MNILTHIKGREAIPARAIPFVLGWKRPRMVLQFLADDAKNGATVCAYRFNSQGAIEEVYPEYWIGLDSLPPAVFFWRADLERFLTYWLSRIPPQPNIKKMPGGYAFNYTADIEDEERAAILQGFEHFGPPARSSNFSGDVAFEDTLSFEQTTFILRDRLGANDYEIEQWILEGWIQAYRHHRFSDDNGCSKADPCRDGEDELFRLRRFLRAEVEGFDPYATPADGLDPRVYPEFVAFSVLDESPRKQAYNPSGRWVSYQQAVDFLTASSRATAPDAEQLIRREIGMPGLTAFGLGDDEPPIEEGFFYESQIVALANVRFGRQFDGWDAITRQHPARQSGELTHPDPPISAHAEPPNQGKALLPKEPVIEARIRAIIETAKSLGYALDSIPRGGKAEIREKLGLTTDRFLKAWKEASRRKLIQTANADKYRPRDQ